MNFLIDFDTRDVIYKSDSKRTLEDYISSNALNDAVTLISSSEDLVLNLTLDEMVAVMSNVSDDQIQLRGNCEDALWDKMNDSQDKTPTMRAPKNHAKPNNITKMVFEIGDNITHTKHIYTRIQNVIEDNLDEATFKELHCRFSKKDIGNAFSKGYIKESEQ